MRYNSAHCERAEILLYLLYSLLSLLFALHLLANCPQTTTTSRAGGKRLFKLNRINIEASCFYEPANITNFKNASAMPAFFQALDSKTACIALPKADKCPTFTSHFHRLTVV